MSLPRDLNTEKGRGYISSRVATADGFQKDVSAILSKGLFGVVCVACDLWCVVCGEWCVACGICFRTLPYSSTYSVFLSVPHWFPGILRSP